MKDEQLAPRFAAYRATRDAAIRDELFEQYLPLARSVARRFLGRGAEADDLEQVAAMALLKALERYDPALGYRFATYAVPTITGALRNHLRDKGGLIRMPRDARQRLYQMTRERERFEAEERRAPSAAELASRMGISAEELLVLLNLQNDAETVSLDAPVGEDMTLEGVLGGEDEGFARFESGEWMRWVYSKVNDTERELLRLRYEERLGQRETAARLGVSQMQVSRLERRVLSRLRSIEGGARA